MDSRSGSKTTYALLGHYESVVEGMLDFEVISITDDNLYDMPDTYFE